MHHHLRVMEATDMRSLSRDARHERRVQVIRLRKAGGTYDEIAAQTGLSRTGVFDICKRHEAAGAKALRDAPSGRKSGDGRLLDAAQEAMVRISFIKAKRRERENSCRRSLDFCRSQGVGGLCTNFD